MRGDAGRPLRTDELGIKPFLVMLGALVFGVFLSISLGDMVAAWAGETPVDPKFVQL
jgi:hypothetical protein